MSMFGPMGQPFVTGSPRPLIPETYGFTPTGEAIQIATSHLGDAVPAELALRLAGGQPDLLRFDAVGNPTRVWVPQPSPAEQAAQMRAARGRQETGVTLEELAALI